MEMRLQSALLLTDAERRTPQQNGNGQPLLAHQAWDRDNEPGPSR